MLCASLGDNCLDLVSNLANSAEAEDIEDSLSSLVGKLLELVHQGDTGRQLSALGALAAVVGAAEEGFKPYASAALQSLSPFLQVNRRELCKICLLASAFLCTVTWGASKGEASWNSCASKALWSSLLSF